MKYDYKQTRDFFSSLNYLEPKNNPDIEPTNYDIFLLGSLQLFRKKAQEIQREKYNMKSFYHFKNDENKKVNKTNHLFLRKNKFQLNAKPLYS